MSFLQPRAIFGGKTRYKGFRMLSVTKCKKELYMRKKKGTNRNKCQCNYLAFQPLNEPTRVNSINQKYDLSNIVELPDAYLKQ